MIRWPIRDLLLYQYKDKLQPLILVKRRASTYKNLAFCDDRILNLYSEKQVFCYLEGKGFQALRVLFFN